MTRYTETLTLALPYSPEMAEICAKLGRAFDPDIGGAESFTVIEDKLVCVTPCVPEFKQQALAMMSNSAYLHGACAADYAARWPEHVPPTLGECEQFLASVEVQ